MLKTTIILLSLIATNISNASEKLIDHIDNEQTKSFSTHCDKIKNTFLSIELEENTSSGKIVLNGFSVLMDVTDKMLEEMRKDWLMVRSYVEGEIR